VGKGSGVYNTRVRIPGIPLTLTAKAISPPSTKSTTPNSDAAGEMLSLLKTGEGFSKFIFEEKEEREEVESGQEEEVESGQEEEVELEQEDKELQVEIGLQDEGLQRSNVVKMMEDSEDELEKVGQAAFRQATSVPEVISFPPILLRKEQRDGPIYFPGESGQETPSGDFLSSLGKDAGTRDAATQTSDFTLTL